MFSKLRRRIRDVATIKALCLGAEQQARYEDQQKPGAEHFLLAALELPDGTARRSFERIHADPNGFRGAIQQQYRDALTGIGVDAGELIFSHDPDAIQASSKGIYDAQPSAQSLMQRLIQLKKIDANVPLLGAHVVLAVTSAQYGVAARALKALGVDSAALTEAARAEIKVCSM